MAIKYPKFSQIEIGEPDANVDYYNAKRAGTIPVFLETFLDPPGFPLADFMRGHKFLLIGQKGTGKTAAIRYLESKLSESFPTQFIVFKKTFNEEADLHQFSSLPIMVDEDNVKKYRHYLHAIKRVLIFVLLKKTFENDKNLNLDDEEGNEWVKKIRNTAVGEIVSLGFESIKSLLQSSGINISEISDNKVLVDASKLIKNNNDDLLSYLVNRTKRLDKSACLFLDEIHFAYRSEEALQQDAMLVRDTIIAMNNLNERFAEDGVKLRIYAAVRAEYLEHPIISSADVNHTVESIGYYLSWSTYPHNKQHPLFRLVYNRFVHSIGKGFSIEEFERVYLGSVEPREFLSRTWVKPRDFIRFFKCVKDMYGDKISLSKSEWNAVWRSYSLLSWNEIKSSASPFMNAASIAALENKFRIIAPKIIDKLVHYDFTDFSAEFIEIYQAAKGDNKSFYSFDHFMDLLYILGIFGTQRSNAGGERIVQTYHRGNRSFHRDGKVMVHPAVLKAFG